MRKLLLIFVFLISFFVLSSSIHAEVPNVINYQGKFTDKENIPLSGNYLTTFRLYGKESGGSALWEEKHILNVNDGIFNVLLGSINILKVDFNKDLWLGIEIANDGEMSPRIKLSSAPYALNAESIDMLDSSQLVRNDTDASIKGTLTLEKNLLLKRSGKIIITDSKAIPYYLWVDKEGNLRFKKNEPASDIDGVILNKEVASKKSNLSLYLSLVSIVFIAIFFILHFRKK